MRMHTGGISLALLLSLPTAALAAEPPPEHGVFVELHAHHLSGWTLRHDTEGPEPYEVNLRDGGGLGVRAGYDFLRYVGVFASAEFNVELEGPYTGYGAGLRVHSPMLGPTRLQARAGMRWLSPGPGIIFGTVGAGAEVFLIRRLSLGFEVDAAMPLTDGTRFNGLTDERVEAEGGPFRVLGGLTWYFGS